MSEATLHRLLELVRRELDAADAHLEIGGEPPASPEVVWCDLGRDWRLVARFDPPPSDRAELQARLDTLAESFGDLSQRGLPERLVTVARATVHRRLDDELATLAARLGAIHAVVLDDRSPVLWGTSEPRGTYADVDAAVALAHAAEAAERAGLSLAKWWDCEPEELGPEVTARGLDPVSSHLLTRAARELREGSGRRGATVWHHHLLATRAIAAVRGALREEPASRTAHLKLAVRNGEFGFLARGFASIYVIVLVYEAQFSELHAEAGLLQALPMIERLVLALPSSDPPPAGGKVLRLPR